MCVPLVSQMSQELGITEKSPDFINPYRTERDDVSKILHHCAHVVTRVDILVTNTHPVTLLVTPTTHIHSFTLHLPTVASVEIAYIFSPASGASHCRGFPEDPEGRGEAEEERREEERNQERPSHLPLSHGAIALHLGSALCYRVEKWREHMHSPQGVA